MKIKSKIKDFEVIFAKDFNFINEFLQIEHYIVIVGSNVYAFYKKSIFNKFPKDKLIIVKLGEQNKTIKTVMKVYEKLLEQTAKKNLTIISFGGGISQDVVGFVSSTLYRGINWIYVPTTLLAMADSAIGLKTSLNFKSYKNVLGTFYPPSKIIINVDFLKTLPKLNYFSGVGEIIKFYLMKGNAISDLDNTLKKIEKLKNNKNRQEILNIIEEGMKIKLSYMEGDEFDTGRRNLLNYGHEFGHALEPASSFRIPHGVAILIGIIFANVVSLKRGLIDKKVFDDLNKHLLVPNIPRDVVNIKKRYFDKDLILENMKKDKKRIGNDLVLVLPQKNFSLIKINNLGIDEYESSLVELRKIIGV
ncbi:MAG: iron-containing alcohol dehydrogenase [Candidatus Levybacteria bacterium]|nr:iron-containing alcohol dehydrogenase [Candidatus Levybacteria bacterium]